ncbi:MAG: DUF975 family protein [Chrysiogenales bacterium]|nr:MAG: DUF975 family protein [Chrysiogenales bacterium]
MKQWYYLVNGQQAGPVTEDAIRAMIQQRRLGPDDLLWTHGMADWLPGHVALPDAFGGVAMVGYASASRSDLPQNVYGTGGQTPNADLMTAARAMLTGHWGLPMGFCLLLFLISAVVQSFPYIGILGALIITGPLQLGAVIFFITFTRRGNPDLGMLFAGFKQFGRALGTYLLMGLFILLWTLLLIIPGIIATYAYSQALYILADNPDVGPMEALRRSKEMMRGHKWKLFCLYCRFIGWNLLCILTLGIGFLWLSPYMNTSAAAFYNDLHSPDAAATAADSMLGGDAGFGPDIR